MKLIKDPRIQKSFKIQLEVRDLLSQARDEFSSGVGDPLWTVYGSVNEGGIFRLLNVGHGSARVVGWRRYPRSCPGIFVLSDFVSHFIGSSVRLRMILTSAVICWRGCG
ncbi:hypothetical protein JTB14_018140 [Gonioctena quinquepunctata]|nr:hypothetical protein JTB14_018140 [Gonioctena quinquepunctata]